MVEEGLKSPVFHGGNRGFDQQRMPGDRICFPDPAGFVDGDAQNDIPLYTGGLGQQRVFWLHAADDVLGSLFSRNLLQVLGCGLGCGCGRRGTDHCHQPNKLEWLSPHGGNYIASTQQQAASTQPNLFTAKDAEGREGEKI